MNQRNDLLTSAQSLAVFVSYAWDDRQQHVRALVKFLQTIRRIRVTIDSDKLAEGLFTQTVPTDAIDQSDVAVLFCNKNYQKSDYCRRVATYAYNQGKMLVPVLLDGETFQPDGWLGDILKDQLSKDPVTFPPEKSFDTIVEELLQHLAKRWLAFKNGQRKSANQPRTKIEIPDYEEILMKPEISTKKAEVIQEKSTQDGVSSPRKELTIFELHSFRPVKMFFSYDATSSVTPATFIDQIWQISSFLAKNGFEIMAPPNNDDFEVSFCQADLILACSNGFNCLAVDETRLRNKKIILIDMDSSRLEKWNNIKSNRFLVTFSIGKRPFAEMLDELLAKISQLMTTKCNIPKSPIPYFKRNYEEELLKNSIKQLCQSTDETFLMVTGEHGVGKTTILSQFFNDRTNQKFLAFECGIETAVWINVSKFCYQMHYNASVQGGSLLNDERRLFESLTEAIELEYGEIYPKNRFNLSTLFASDKRNYGRFLVILDDYVNVTNSCHVLEALAEIGPFLRCIVVCAREGEAIPSQSLVGNGGKILSQLTATILPMNDLQTQKMLSASLDWKVGQFGLTILSKFCYGLPLLVKMLLGNFELMTTLPGNGDTSLKKADFYCNWLCQHLEKIRDQPRPVAIRQIASRLFGWNFEQSAISQNDYKNKDDGGHFYDNRTNSALRVFSAFLCFPPGHPVEVEDLAVLWNCEANSADCLCNSFVQRGLLNPGHFKSGIVTSVCLNKLIHKIGFDYASMSRHLFMTYQDLLANTLATPEVARIAVKNHRERLLKLIFLELDARVLEKVARFNYRGAKKKEENNDASKREENSGPFCELLFNENWRQNQGTRYERNMSAEMLSTLIESLSMKGGSFVDVVHILASPNETSGDCVLLEISESTDTTAEGVKLKRQTEALLNTSRKKLFREALFERRRWIQEARDCRNNRLFAAAIRNDDLLVISVLNSGVNVNQPNSHRGETALMAACANGCFQVVGLLLERGALINSRSHDSMTPLHFAAKNGHDQIVDLLLSFVGPQGANINAAEAKCGMTALMYSARAGHRKVVDILRRHPGLQVDLRSANNGSTALMMAAQKGHTAIVEDLAIIGADPNTANNDGVTALMLAAENGHLDTVKFIASFVPGDLDARRHDGMTAISLACQAGHDQIVAYLRMNGASVTIPAFGIFGRYPMHFAAQNGHATVLETLRMTGGAENIDLADSGPREATALLLAAEMGHSNVVKLLVAHKSEVNVTDKSNGYSALMLAARGGYWAVVEFLAGHGGDIDRVSPITGETALHLAARNGHELCVEFLVKRGDINARCKTKGWTALQYAIDNGHAAVCRYLYYSCHHAGTEANSSSMMEEIGCDNTLRLMSSNDSQASGFAKMPGETVPVRKDGKKTIVAVPQQSKNKNKSGPRKQVRMLDHDDHQQ